MITLYGIKNCDTIKKSQKWLNENNATFIFHDYRVDGIDADLLDHFLCHTVWEDLINKRSTSFRNLTEDQKQQLLTKKGIDLVLAQPTLIKRPILIKGDKIHIGFSVDKYRELISSTQEQRRLF